MEDRCPCCVDRCFLFSGSCNGSALFASQREYKDADGFPRLLLEENTEVYENIFNSLKIHWFCLKHVLRKHRVLNLVLFFRNIHAVVTQAGGSHLETPRSNEVKSQGNSI